MEAFGLTVSFSLYGDLLGISQWARDELEKEKAEAAAEKIKNKQMGKREEKKPLNFQPDNITTI